MDQRSHPGALGHGVAHLQRIRSFSNLRHKGPTPNISPSLFSTGSTPKAGQARGEAGDGGRDGATVAGARKAIQAGVPAAKIDGRLTERFVAASTACVAAGAIDATGTGVSAVVIPLGSRCIDVSSILTISGTLNSQFCVGRFRLSTEPLHQRSLASIRHA